jgi:hypothetical protein
MMIEELYRRVFNLEVEEAGETTGGSTTGVGGGGGIPGPMGLMGMDGEDGEAGMIGPTGPRGATGATGPAGSGSGGGAMGIPFLGDYPEDVIEAPYIHASIPPLDDVAFKSRTNAFTGANSFATNPLDLLVGQLKFPAAANPSANANTLDDYEEGAWTPVDTSGAALVFGFAAGTYTKIGAVVTINFQIIYPTTANGLAAKIGGLPFTVAGGNSAAYIGFGGIANQEMLILGGTTDIQPVTAVTGVNITNAQLSGTNTVYAGFYS